MIFLSLDVKEKSGAQSQDKGRVDSDPAIIKKVKILKQNYFPFLTYILIIPQEGSFFTDSIVI
jgi:hypothetical protein|tara:strand:- start:264 stop:452 length:189 start_codon:yes stop_codon:yes gene_type:complete